MKKWLMFFSAAFIFVQILPSAFSIQAEMKIFPKKASACQFSVAAYEIEVENPGPSTDTFEFSSSSPDFIVIAPEKLRLRPKEVKKVFAWYNPTDELAGGVYDFSIKARSRATGEISEVFGKIEVIECHKVSLEFEKESQTTCPGEVAEYEIKVTNEGTSSEEFELETNFGNLSRKRIFLEAKESDKVILRVAGENLGTLDLVVTAKSKTSFARDSKSAVLNTIACYDSEVIVTPASQRICAGLEGEYEIEVINKGLKPDQFILESSLGKLSKTSFSLNSGESRKLRLEFKPEEIKDFEILLSLKSRSAKNVSIIAQGINCKIPEILIEPANLKICENELGKFKITAKNIGELRDTFKLKNNLGIIEKNKLSLRPNESDRVDLEVNALELGEGLHSISVDMVSSTNASDRAEANLTVDNCYDLVYDFNVKRALGGRALLYTFLLNNTGSKKNSYEIEVFDGVISLKPEENLSLDSGESGESFLFYGLSQNVTAPRNFTLKIRDSSGMVNVVREISLLEEEVTISRYEAIYSFLRDIAKRIPLDLIIAVALGLLIFVALLLRKR